MGGRGVIAKWESRWTKMATIDGGVGGKRKGLGSVERFGVILQEELFEYRPIRCCQVIGMMVLSWFGLRVVVC